MGGSKVTKSAAGASKSAKPKTSKAPKKVVATYKRLMLLFTCLESVLARPGGATIDWEIVSKKLNRSRGSVTGEYYGLRKAILESQEEEEDTDVVSPTKDKKTAETPDKEH
ncbi:hypothetical protein N7486_004691 [Penicillium sp. IBT 16267x]|nr:hypothetical protein N7486_004691 [Penicillium sp. IBT 16267x]